MKNFIATSIVMSSLFLTSCVKTETKKTKIDLPEIKKYEPITIKKSGYKCDLVGELENKEIFIKLEKKEDKTTASFHDFISKDKISIISAKFEGYNLMSISLAPSSENEKVLVGESVLTHSDLESLSSEGKVFSITGRLTLNEDLSGVLEQKQMISKEDHSIETTEYKELGKVENCEAFDAIWI